jgi:hypothetical protein
MSDHAFSTGFFQGERISGASLPRAADSTYRGGRTISPKNITTTFGGLPTFCVAVVLWAAPALLLTRVRPSELFVALANAPLSASVSHLLILLFAVAYVVTTGLLLGGAVERLVPRSRWTRVATRIVLAPMILLSLGATAALSVPVFLGLTIRCFPSLL